MPEDDLSGCVARLEAENRRLRRLLDRRDAPGSLRHQLRNTLSTVREFVRRSAETSADVDDYAAHLDGRLDAVLRVQNAIANGPGEGEVSLHALVADEFLAQAIGEGQRASIAGPEITFKPIAASAFALALHELATNAVKFGALTVPGGRLDVSWSVAPGYDGAPRLDWAWTEDGLAGLAPAPGRRGFGLDLVERSLRYQLSAAVDLRFAPTGLRCAVRLPLLAWVGRCEPTADRW